MNGCQDKKRAQLATRNTVWHSKSLLASAGSGPGGEKLLGFWV